MERRKEKKFDELEMHARATYAGYEIGLGFKCVEGSPGIGGNRISVLVSRQIFVERVGVSLRTILWTYADCRVFGSIIIISEHRHRSSFTVNFVRVLIGTVL